MKIPPFTLKEITDSKGMPTLEVSAILHDETIVAKVPSGTSTGKDEASVLAPHQAVSLNNELNTLLAGQEFNSIKEFDQKLIDADGTNDKSKLGGNTILALSMLFCRLCAKANDIELFEYLKSEVNIPSVIGRPKPLPMMVMIEGGVHARHGANIQELLVNCQVTDGDKIWQVLDKSGHPLGMEGGFDISLPNTENKDDSALHILNKAISEASVTASLSIDMAANNIDEVDRYSVDNLIELIKKYNLFSVEDPFIEEDEESWARLSREIEGRRLSTIIVGDDLTVTNPAKLKDALAKKLISGVIIKPNQVGSVSETLEFAKIAKENKLFTIVSHRSGETDDDFIADLAVAINADSLKAGANSKPERKVKYARLSAIT